MQAGNRFLDKFGFSNHPTVQLALVQIVSDDISVYSSPRLFLYLPGYDFFIKTGSKKIIGTTLITKISDKFISIPIQTLHNIVD